VSLEENFIFEFDHGRIFCEFSEGWLDLKVIKKGILLTSVSVLNRGRQASAQFAGRTMASLRYLRISRASLLTDVNTMSA